MGMLVRIWSHGGGYKRAAAGVASWLMLALPAAGQLEGTYTSNWGDIRFSSQSELVTGEYDSDGGRITGTFEGVRLSGYWSETASARQCETARDGRQHWGRVVLEFNEDLSAFNGIWGYCDEDFDGSWTGSLTELTDDPGEVFDFDEALVEACPHTIEISDPPPGQQQAPAQPLTAYAEDYLPSFTGRPWVHETAARWKAIVRQLGSHMARRPGRDRIQELVRWQADRDKLLGDLVLVEEELVWSLPGSFYTPEEIELLRPGFVRLSQAREKAAALARTNARARELFDRLTAYEQFYNTVQQKFAAGEGQGFAVASVLSMAHAQCSDTLRQVEGMADDLRRDILGAVSELAAAFAEVVQSRRNRGLAEIDRLRAEAAAAAGLPAPPPFRLHRPNTRKEYENLARLMSEQFGNMVSGGLPFRFPSDMSRSFFDLPAERQAALTQSEIERLTQLTH